MSLSINLTESHFLCRTIADCQASAPRGLWGNLCLIGEGGIVWQVGKEGPKLGLKLLSFFHAAESPLWQFYLSIPFLIKFTCRVHVPFVFVFCRQSNLKAK